MILLIFRVLFFIAIAGVIYYIIRSLTAAPLYKKCQKCDGKGYWRAMRGEKDRCDVCKGSGKIER